MLETTNADDMSDRVQRVLDQRVRPFLQSHGGDVEISSIIEQDGLFDVSLALRGACRHCDLRAVTFSATIHSHVSRILGVKKVSCDGTSITQGHIERIQKFFGSVR